VVGDIPYVIVEAVVANIWGADELKASVSETI
jgi:hypothetical protein